MELNQDNAELNWTEPVYTKLVLIKANQTELGPTKVDQTELVWTSLKWNKTRLNWSEPGWINVTQNKLDWT